MAYHDDPLDFMQWIDGVTWKSEWPKYRVTDAGGAGAAGAAAPRPRRFA
jgi:hypothetical protein